MKYCQYCGKELLDESVVCPGCGCPTQTGYQNTAPVSDEINVGLVILAVIVPLFGIIYWAVKAKERPRGAKACGIAALISWGAGIVFSIIWCALIASTFLF